MWVRVEDLLKLPSNNNKEIWKRPCSSPVQAHSPCSLSNFSGQEVRSPTFILCP